MVIIYKSGHRFFPRPEIGSVLLRGVQASTSVLKWGVVCVNVFFAPTRGVRIGVVLVFITNGRVSFYVQYMVQGLSHGIRAVRPIPTGVVGGRCRVVRFRRGATIVCGGCLRIIPVSFVVYIADF